MTGRARREAPARLAGATRGQRTGTVRTGRLAGLATVGVLLGLVVLALLAARADAGTTPTPDPAPVCRAGFAWGGECWTRREGQAFAGWLREHGASPAAFKRRHPELARTFGKDWPPKPVPTSSVGIIRAVFPDWAEDYAIAIARCETGGTFNPRASGDGGNSIGLFQINVVWWHLSWVGGPDRLVDPWHNSRVALRISGGGRDWSPWTCARYV